MVPRRKGQGHHRLMSHRTFVWLCLLPLAVVTMVFFVLPMVRLVVTGAEGPQGLAGYLAIPRVILTIMAAVQKLDKGLEEAARSLGASPWAVQRDVVLPALAPAFVASGAIAFATAMGAFGTAFTLATNIDVLPMLIYTEFTLAANFATSAALSVGLGLITWFILALARSFSGSTVAAAG